MPIPDDVAKQGAKPGWMGYVGVDDVDAAAAKLSGKGARFIVGPRPFRESSASPWSAIRRERRSILPADCLLMFATTADGNCRDDRLE